MGKKILWGLLGLIALLCYGLAWYLWERTLVAAWIPLAVCGGITLLSGLTMWRLWRWLTASGKVWLNYLCHFVFWFGVLLVAFFGLNRLYADESTIHKEKVVVERKYHKVHHKTRRVGRRTYSTGETYNVYYMELRFSDGRLKEIPSTFENNRRRHKGDTIHMEMETGLWGIPILNY